MNALDRDEVHLSVRGLLDVLHLGRSSRPCKYRLRPSPVVSLQRVLFSTFIIFTQTSIRTYKNISIWKMITHEPIVSRRTGKLLSRWPWFWGSTPARGVFFFLQCKNMYDHRWWLKCRKSSREVSLPWYILTLCCWRCCCCCSVYCYYCFSFSYVDAVCGFATEYLDLIDYNN